MDDAGATVRHRSRLRREPDAPNLRQVHLLGAELLHRLTDQSCPVTPGRVGENILTRGLELLAAV